MINWNASKADYKLAARIAQRACSLVEYVEYAQIEMDVIACHCSGCPLDLAQLLEFGKFEFLHDVLGIRKNIDRETGALGNLFCPRCALLEPIEA